MFSNTDFSQIAKTFAVSLINETEKLKLEKSNKKLSYKATVIKPKLKDIRASEIFSNIDNAMDGNVEVRAWPIKQHSIPGIDSNYYFRSDLLSDVLNFLTYKSDYGLWLVGKHGTGKTSVIEQVCSRLGWHYFSDTGSERTEFLDLFGYMVPTVNDGVKFIKGSLLNAMEQGGVYCLNEIDAMLPSELIKLNELTAHKPIFVAQLEKWVVPHQDFRFIATSNTNGCGDDGSYVGTNMMNAAFKDRWMMLEVDYLPKEIEILILQSLLENKKTTIGNNRLYDTYLEVANLMVTAARLLRQMSGVSCSTPPSTRTLKLWMTLVLQGGKLKPSFLKAYANKLNKAETMAAIEVCVDVFGKAFV